MTTKAGPETITDRSVCPDSPLGAHHWVLGAPGPKMIGQCKYCRAERTFSPFEEELGFNNSPKKNRGSAAAGIDGGP